MSLMCIRSMDFNDLLSQMRICYYEKKSMVRVGDCKWEAKKVLFWADSYETWVQTLVEDVKKATLVPMLPSIADELIDALRLLGRDKQETEVFLQFKEAVLSHLDCAYRLDNAENIIRSLAYCLGLESHGRPSSFIRFVRFLVAARAKEEFHEPITQFLSSLPDTYVWKQRVLRPESIVWLSQLIPQQGEFSKELDLRECGLNVCKEVLYEHRQYVNLKVILDLTQEELATLSKEGYLRPVREVEHQTKSLLKFD